MKLSVFREIVRKFELQELNGKQLQMMVTKTVADDGKVVTTVAGFDFSTGKMYIISETTSENSQN